MASPRPPIPPASRPTSAANRPPCRGRQVPGTYDRPGGTFPRVFNPSLRPRKRDERKAHEALHTGESPRVQGGGVMAAVSCPSPFSRRANVIFRPKADTPTASGKPLIFRGFEPRIPKSQDGHSGLWADSVARGISSRNVRSRALRSRERRRAGACGCKSRSRARCGAQPTPIAAAHHCQKINRVGSNRRELARR